jgi:membrane protein
MPLPAKRSQHKAARFIHSSGVPAWARHQASLPESALRIWYSARADRVFGHAAELSFYFLFALFPTLLCVASALGLVARSARQISDKLLEYLALVLPTSALATVLNTFNETTAAATSGKLTFGSIAAIWSAAVGVSALQDTLNVVFRLDERRSYFAARLDAILVTILLTFLMGSALGCLLAGDFAAALIEHRMAYSTLAIAAGISVRVMAWAASACILALSFATVYYWAPDWRVRRWRWLTPGTVLAITGWLMASFGLRIYLHFFNGFTLTYGSLGAVIILLIWFYSSGLMLLLGAEVDMVADESRREGLLAEDIPGACQPVPGQNSGASRRNLRREARG